MLGSSKPAETASKPTKPANQPKNDKPVLVIDDSDLDMI
jgi:hypothetical protein